MKKENVLSKNVWPIMLVLSILFFVWTIPLLFLSGGQIILEDGLKYAGSPFDVGSVDHAGLGFLNMSMLKPLWEEIWIGILGVYCTLGLKQGKRHAWWLALSWGIMLITDATIQGVYEVVGLEWSSACMQTYLFLLLGALAVASLLLTRKSYFRRLT